MLFSAFGTHAVLVLDDVLPNGGESRPLTVVGGSNCTALVSLKLTNCNTHNIRHVNTKRAQTL